MFLRATVCLLCFISLNPAQAIAQQRTVSEKQRAEEAADRFIRRWRQTLDLNLLFDEMFVARPENRKVFMSNFRGLAVYISNNLTLHEITEDVDEKLRRAAMMAMWNYMHLREEYALAFGKLALEIHETGEDEAEEGPDVLTGAHVTKFIADLEKPSAEYKKPLTAEIFESPLYRLNLKRYQESPERSSEVFKVTMNDFSHRGGGRGVKVYRLRRGVFDFYFVEEEGKLKVLSLGLEP